MPSKITLTFTGIPADATNVVLKDQFSIGLDLAEYFKPVRTFAYQSKIGVDILATITNYAAAFNADYNTTSLYTVTVDGINFKVIIEHPDDGYFTAGEFQESTGVISYLIEDTPDPILINIEDVSFVEASTTPCSRVQLDVITDVLATIVRVDGGTQIDPNTDNPFDFDSIRGSYINLEVENAEGNTDSLNIQVPKALSVSNTAVSVVNSPSGATVTAVVSESDGLILLYSLDDITYQSSNSFSSILEGSYTFYIKDQLGCSIEVPFTVAAYEDGGVGVQFPVADLPSKSNSIRYARRVTNENCSNYKNDENTLSCEQAFTQNPRQVNQLFQNCDIITTQIKSNYGTIAATVIEVDGTETMIPVDQKTTNIAQKGKRDAFQYQLPDGQSGIYFRSGYTYDFDTDIQNGTYALNGGLPIWGVIGNYVIIGAAWFEIVNIIFDESKNAEVLVIDDNYIGSDNPIIAGSIYNLQEYEVYEFTINMGSYSDRSIQVNITETDPTFDDVIFLSEILDIQERHADTVEVVYFSDINTDIFYSTGIINKIRVPIEYIEGGFEDETEAEKTDINVYPINAEIYETDTFHFQLLSKQLMRKVMQSLAHKFVTLDEVGYVKESSPNMAALIGTNLYRLSAPMTKAENVYTSQGTGLESEVAAIEVPNLIEQTSDGYIKWS